MRPILAPRGFVTSALAAAAMAAPSMAQSFDKLPYFYTRQPETFAVLFQTARTKLVHGLIFGDSQETCPQGAGEQYIINLNREFADWYGSCDATPWSQAGASFGGGNPWGEWLVRAANAPPGPVPRPYPERWLPPGMQSCPADRNADGFADAFDLDEFLTQYELGRPEADIDGDGFVDAFDISAFLDAFERGCG